MLFTDSDKAFDNVKKYDKEFVLYIFYQFWYFDIVEKWHKDVIWSSWKVPDVFIIDIAQKRILATVQGCYNVKVGSCCKDQQGVCTSYWGSHNARNSLEKQDDSKRVVQLPQSQNIDQNNGSQGNKCRWNKPLEMVICLCIVVKNYL